MTVADMPIPPEVQHTGLDDLLEAAWDKFVSVKGRGSRPTTFSAVYPRGTMAVSVTGKSCPLNCAHCGGHYLEHMVDIRDLERELEKRTPTSILLSGGCGPDGAVPLASVIGRVRKHLDPQIRINVHPGVANDEDAAVIAENASVVSFDMVLDDLAIQEAFKGKWSGADYIRTFRTLSKGRAKVVPHILVGLRKGVIAGEYDVLDFLVGEGVEKVIFIVLIPTRGTEWENVSPPSPEDVARLLAWARLKKPSLEISLGCMRPGGRYRRDLDVLAVRAGVDRIVLPHPDAVAEAESRGSVIARKGECCAFE